MNASSLNATELDLHRLDAPYAQTRVQRPQQVRRLMASIDADGQRVPLVVVADGERFVLVDGYQRWAALSRLGRDTAQVEVWDGPAGGGPGRRCWPATRAAPLSPSSRPGCCRRRWPRG